jgi:hypothetical protein
MDEKNSRSLGNFRIVSRKKMIQNFLGGVAAAMGGFVILAVSVVACTAKI